MNRGAADLLALGAEALELGLGRLDLGPQGGGLLLQHRDALLLGHQVRLRAVQLGLSARTKEDSGALAACECRGWTSAMWR